MKTCNLCGCDLPEDHPKKNGRKCKDCFRKYHKEYFAKWRLENKEKANEYRKKWTKNNPDKMAKNTMRWREKNREKYNLYQKMYQMTWEKKKIDNDKELE